jgi:hypothetical protein
LAKLFTTEFKRHDSKLSGRLDTAEKYKNACEVETIEACKKGDLSEIKKLQDDLKYGYLSRVAESGDGSISYWNGLFYAIQNNHLDIVKFLFEDCDINRKRALTLTLNEFEALPSFIEEYESYTLVMCV